MTTPINPELLLKAAEMAIPGVTWVISGGIVMDDDAPSFYGDWFNPITSDHDAMKLERALKKEGWHFSWCESFDFHASNLSRNFQHEMDPSDTLLLLKCVSATTNLPMSTGGDEK